MKRALIHFAFATALLVCVLVLAGCASQSDIVKAQTPGTATGAGATLTAPGNSAAPSTQHSKRKVQQTVRKEPAAVSPAVAPTPAGPAAKPVQPAPGWPAPTLALQPPPATVTTTTTPDGEVTTWTEETETDTTIGQHQDAAAIIKVASAVGSWGKARVSGIVIVIAALFGLAWSHNNPDGYPVVCWKGLAIGSGLIVFDPSPWWLALLIIPAGLWFAQKMGWKIPGVPL